jgi:glyoxylase-like metal-dependent hydrolase (beta-lactamase superfamily II)
MPRFFALRVSAALLLAACGARFEPPVEVRATGILDIKNQFVDLYAAKTSAGVVLFDAGVDRKGAGVDAALQRLHATPDEVIAIFTTHGHGDHIAAATRFPKATIYAGKGDVSLMSGERKNPSRLGRLFGRLFKFPLVKNATALEGSSDITVGGEVVTAIPLPGHTAGSYAYVFRGVLFVGDSMNFKRGKLQPALKGTSEDIATNRTSLAALPTTLGTREVRLVCTGHQGCTPPEASALLQDLAARAAKP